MLGSHACFTTASARALYFKFLFFSSHCCNWITSRGYVEAASVCASSGSGYKAIGATRESNCSGGVLGVWLCGEDAVACQAEDVTASVSPGTTASMQTIASNDRKVAPFRLTFMGTSPLAFRPVILEALPNRP